MIALHVLADNGGVLLNELHALTEDLRWIEEVYDNPYVNRLDRSYPTEVVGFFDPEKSSERVRKLTDEPVNAPFKMIRPYPALLPSFLAAKKGARFLI